MKNPIFLFMIAAVVLLLGAIPVHAEPQPGDACSTLGLMLSTGGPEQMPARVLICNGTTWLSAHEQSTAGKSLLQIDNDAGSCTTAKSGRIRYNGTTTWEYCNGTAWTTLGGGGSTSPGGAGTNVQFNDGGAFGGDADYTWDKTGNVLTVTGKVSVSQTVSLGATAGAAAPVLMGTSAGAPAAGDCDADAERGRLRIDTTNNRLYVCNGATRGWDYVALTN